MPPIAPALLPAVAVRTHFSAVESGTSPAGWTQPLADHGPGRVLLADRDDLGGLPAAIAAWGRERIAVGATIAWGETASDVILAAPDQEAYARLCRLLSRRHEDPEGSDLDATGLIALVRDAEAARDLRERGAEVVWRCDATPDPAPDGLTAVCLPVCTAPGAADRAGDAIRRAVARREGRRHAPGHSLDGIARVAAAFRERPDLVDAGRALVDRCTYVPGGTWHMPPSLHADAEGELLRRAVAGMQRRYGAAPPAAVRERLGHELQVIGSKGFAGYILTVADLAAGRRTCGRGSGASSLVCYCLGITNVDPVRYHLLFERFLNPARTDPPDLDVDFPWDERDDVLRAAIRTYGHERVAMVATHQYLRRWSALRVVARAFRRPDAETTAVRRMVQAGERYGSAVRLDEPWTGILDQAEHLIGTPHHVGLHCGGIIITPGPVRDLVPVHPAAKRIADPEADDDQPASTVPVPAIAWEKDGAEAMGLVKIDLLGNRSLAVVRDTLADLAEDGIAIDEARWRPADDPATRALVASGATMGCFYIESPAMRQLQAKAGSGEFDRLVIHSSIIRPAANRWIEDYLERLHQWRTTKRQDDAWYPHPALRELLSESFGILSYQEDVMLAAIRIAGFDDRQANGLRKALGHWDTQARLTRFAAEFRAGATARGVPNEVIEQVWANISSFAGYSFCKAHSASYAMVSFQCAWLKAHHPAYFLARVVANEGGFYEPAAYLEEARRLGVRILAPCVVASSVRTCRESPEAIRCGLHLVPGLSAASAGRLVAERQRRPFTGIADLRRRVRLDAGQLDTLARVGALDALCPGLHRAQVRWTATAVGLEPAHRFRSDEDDDGVTRIFPLPPLADPPAPDLPALSPRQAAWEQFIALGISPAGHPIWFCQRPRQALRCRDVTAKMAKKTVTVVAWPITRKQVDAHPTAKPGTTAGPPEPMSFVTLEDETGLVETVWFPEAYRRYGPLLDRGCPLALTGRVEVAYGVASLSVTAAEAVAIEPGPVDPSSSVKG
jgi:error-prone DNA polymerase